MTPEELQSIRERAEKATPGPWAWECYPSMWSDDCGKITAPGTTVCEFGFSTQYYPSAGIEPNDDDRAFITAARTDIPALLAHIAELEAYLAYVESDLLP